MGFTYTPFIPNDYIEVRVKCASAPGSLSFDHALTKYNKSAIMLPCHDDVNIEAYTRTFDFVKSMKYTDGCGKEVNWHYTLALNGNYSSHDGSNPTVSSFAQIRKMMQTGLFDIANHSLDHSGVDKLYELKQNQRNIQKELGVYPTVFVIPSAEEGYTQANVMDNKHMVSSEFPLNSADGYNSLIFYSGRIPISSVNANLDLILSNRYYIPNDNTLVSLLKTITDTEFTDSVFPTMYALNWFHHDNQISGDIEPFIGAMEYIRDHPDNNDRLGVFGYQEFYDFYVTQRDVVIDIEDDTEDDTVKILKINYKDLDSLIRWRDLTLNLTSDVDIESITAFGADDYSFNLETGQLNIYKNNKYQIKAADEVWPPQITGVNSIDNIATIVYNRPVTQSNIASPYTVKDYTDPDNPIDNPVISITGSGTEWDIQCANTITSNSKLDYRPQNGGTTQEVDTDKLVFPYIGQPITVLSIETSLDTFFEEGDGEVFATVKLIDDAENCIRVRKDTDGDPEMDIGFDGFGIDLTSLSNFLEEADGYLVKVYGQRGIKTIEQSDPAKQPKIKFDALNGRIGIDNSGDKFMKGDDFFDSSYNGNISVFNLAKSNVNALQAVCCATSNANLWMYSQTGGLKVAGVTGMESYLPFNTYTRDVLNGFTHSSGIRKQFINTELRTVSGDLTTTFSNTDDLWFGCFAGEGFNWNGDIYCQVYMNKGLSDSEARRVHNIILNAYGMSEKPFLLFLGNSLTTGVGSSNPPETAYPTLVANALGGDSVVEHSDLGISGGNLSDIIYSSQVGGSLYFNYDPRGRDKVVIIWEGTNTILPGITAQAVYDLTLEVVNIWRARGFRPLVMTTIPFHDQNSVKEEYNTLLRNSDEIGTIIDIAADSRFVLGDTDVYADGVHLTDLGYTYVAENVTTVLETILNL